MFTDRINMTEAGNIGEELMKDNPLTELDRKCLVVRQVVQEGDFSLEDALNLYQLSRIDFEKFITMEHSSFDVILKEHF